MAYDLRVKTAQRSAPIFSALPLPLFLWQNILFKNIMLLLLKSHTQAHFIGTLVSFSFIYQRTIPIASLPLVKCEEITITLKKKVRGRTKKSSRKIICKTRIDGCAKERQIAARPRAFRVFSFFHDRIPFEPSIINHFHSHSPYKAFSMLRCEKF